MPGKRIPSAINIPALKHRKKPKRKRLRRARPDATSLAEAVRRILVRMASRQGAFCVFSINSRLVISESSGCRFSSLSRRWPDALVGIYDHTARVTDLIDDLKCFFSDEGGANVPS